MVLFHSAPSSSLSLSLSFCLWLCVLVGSRQSTAPASVTAAAAAVAAAAGTTAGLVEQGSAALQGPIPLPLLSVLSSLHNPAIPSFIPISISIYFVFLYSSFFHLFSLSLFTSHIISSHFLFPLPFSSPFFHFPFILPFLFVPFYLIKLINCPFHSSSFVFVYISFLLYFPFSFPFSFHFHFAIFLLLPINFLSFYFFFLCFSAFFPFPVYFSIHFLSYFLFDFLFSCLSHFCHFVFFSVSFISSMKETCLCSCSPIILLFPLFLSLVHDCLCMGLKHVPVLPALSFLSSTLCHLIYLAVHVWYLMYPIIDSLHCLSSSLITISLIFYLFYWGSTPRSLHDECIVPSHSRFSSFHTVCAINHGLFVFFWVILILLLFLTFLCHFYQTPISHLHFHPLYSSFTLSVKLKCTPRSGGGTVCLLLCWMLHGRLD